MLIGQIHQHNINITSTVIFSCFFLVFFLVFFLYSFFGSFFLFLFCILFVFFLYSFCLDTSGQFRHQMFFLDELVVNLLSLYRCWNTDCSLNLFVLLTRILDRHLTASIHKNNGCDSNKKCSPRCNDGHELNNSLCALILLSFI